MKTTYKVVLLIVAIIVGFMYYSCESNPIDSTKTETQIAKVSTQPLCVKYKVFENGREVNYWFSCSYQIIVETQESKFITFFYEDGGVAYSFDIRYVMNGSTVFYSPTETQIAKVSTQPLCVKYKVFENGREVNYWFSCSYQIIEETQESKFITFFYADNSVAYSFDIRYVMNVSRVYYAPDCD